MKKSIEEQVAELTEKQKDKIVKTGKVGLFAQLIGAAAIIVFILLFGSKIIPMPAYGSKAGFLFGFTIGCVAVYVIIVWIIAKIICPQYSDRKAQQIIKERKNKEK